MRACIYHQILPCVGETVQAGNTGPFAKRHSFQPFSPVSWQEGCNGTLSLQEEVLLVATVPGRGG